MELLLPREEARRACPPPLVILPLQHLPQLGLEVQALLVHKGNLEHQAKEECRELLARPVVQDSAETNPWDNPQPVRQERTLEIFQGIWVDRQDQWLQAFQPPRRFQAAPPLQCQVHGGSANLEKQVVRGALRILRTTKTMMT